jgi:hypothetical protein
MIGGFALVVAGVVFNTFFLIGIGLVIEMLGVLQSLWALASTVSGRHNNSRTQDTKEKNHT